MKTTHSTRALETAAPVRATAPDFEVEQMEGFYGLGMHRQALASARRVLARTKLRVEAFARTVILVLSSARQLKPWIPSVETAWKGLTPRARRRVRAQMLAFRYAAETLDQALPLATVRPQDASDLMFSLATFTHHQRETSARRLVKAGLRHLEYVTDPFERATLWRAIARYHLARKEWSRALVAAGEMPPELAFVEEQHRDMAAALRGSAEEALGRLNKLRRPNHAVSQPGLDATLIAAAHRRLTRLRNSLAWVNAK